MSEFVAIDLSQVPAPAVIEPLDFETILVGRKQALISYYPAAEQAAVAAQLELESDPRTKLLQESAYRELLLRARINDAAHAVLLPYAKGPDLDNLGALFGVQRRLITPANALASPPTSAVYEQDEEFRYRIQLSLEGLSTAGPEGAYIFHALSASGEVLDASATSPAPGEVVITVLSRTGNGTPTGALLATVAAALTDERVRPLTDFVQVQAPTIVNYQVNATLYFYAGPDRAVILANAQQAIAAYTQAQHRLGRDITLSGIYAALHQPGVQRVSLTSPAQDLSINGAGALHCTSITLVDGGVDD